jgi:hypothetical protein
MPESMAGGLLQMLPQLLQLRQQAEQFDADQALRQRASQLAALQTLSGITSAFPDRNAALSFLAAVAPQLGLDPYAVDALAEGQAPTETSLRAGAARSGRQAIPNVLHRTRRPPRESRPGGLVGRTPSTTS